MQNFIRKNTLRQAINILPTFSRAEINTNQRTLSNSSYLYNMSKAVSESHDFPREEEKILNYWKQIDAFKTSSKLSEGKQRLVLLATLYLI